MATDNRDDVGFGKPPQHSQFKKGKSGNPRGRPKGRFNVATVLEKALREKVIVNENGRRLTITKMEAAFKQLVNKAAAGDLPALQLLARIARSGEERTAEAATTPSTAISELDQKVLEGILQRYGVNIQGAGDDTFEPQ
jgi:hypothetical protein